MDTADLRLGVRNQLVTELMGSPPLVTNVYWTDTAPADTELPFLVMGFLEDMPAMNPHGMFKQVEVLVVGEPQQVHNLEPIADQVIAALHDIYITTPGGRRIRLKYQRDSWLEFYSETLKATVIRLKFSLPTDLWI